MVGRRHQVSYLIFMTTLIKIEKWKNIRGQLPHSKHVKKYSSVVMRVLFCTFFLEQDTSAQSLNPNSVYNSLYFTSSVIVCVIAVNCLLHETCNNIFFVFI